MNQNYFNIFKKYRERKYERDLGYLKNESGLKGQAFVREEKRLKGDYEDEIAMKKEETDSCEEEQKSIKKERRNQIWTNRIIVTATVISLVFVTPMSIYLAVTQPERERKIERQNQIKSEVLTLYRTIVANEDIFIDNSNSLREFMESTSLNTLPSNYIKENLNLGIQDELQNKIGLINYRFLLYYIEQTNLLNDTILEIKRDLPANGLESQNIVESKNFYRDLMNYLSQEGWEETKFNYQLDTGCLLKILQEVFPYIHDERNVSIECRNESLNRIYYHFGYYEVDTSQWMKPRFREAMKDRGVDAWWID